MLLYYSINIIIPRHSMERGNVVVEDEQDETEEGVGLVNSVGEE